MVLTGAGLASGSLALFFCASGAGLFSLGVLSLCHQMTPNLWSVKFLCISFASQPLLLAVLTMFGYFEGVGRYVLPVFLPDYPLRTALALMVIPAAIATCSAGFRTFTGSGVALPSHTRWLWAPPANLPYYLIFGALVSLSVWFNHRLGENIVSYFARVLHKALFLVPMLAGVYATRYRRITLLWMSVLAANLAMSFVTGSRAWGFIPAILYGMGYFLAAPKDKKLKVILFGAPAAVALFLLAGVTSLVRETIGRGGGEVISSQRINDALVEANTAVTSSSVRGSLEPPLFKALTRTIFWTNVAVPLMAPDKVSYRGVGGVKSEVISAISLGREGDFHGAVVANDYGFLVNEGTSVEFGILPDGWSRGGPIVAYLYGVIGTLFLLLAEIAITRIFARRTGLMIVLLCYVFFVSVIGFVSYSLVLQIRLAILCIGFLAVLLWPLELLTGRSDGSRNNGR